jgi:hypothetical protein
MARLHNWLKGQPRDLLPGISSAGSLTYDEGDDLTLPVRLYPSGYHHTRLWSLRGTGSGQTTVTVGSLAARTYFPSAAPSTTGLAIPRLETLEIHEELGSLPTALTAVDIDVRLQIQESIGSLEIMDLRCWEVPHPFLTDAQGQDTTRIVSGQPITASLVSNLRAGAADQTIGHRVLSAWAVPYATGATPTTTTLYAASNATSTWTSIWDTPVPVLMRNTTGAPGAGVEIRADVFAWVSAGGDGDVRITTTSAADDVSQNVTTTTPAWTSSPTTTEASSEDLSTTTGLPGGTWDLADIEFRATVGTIYVAGVVIYEPTS